MTPAQRAEVARLCGPVAQVAPMAGGDLSSVYRVALAGGDVLVAKIGPDVAAEAAMLRAIAATGCPCPDVRAVMGPVLLMSWLDGSGAPDKAGWRALGTSLRRLHGSVGAGYGWPTDYAFGPVAIPNTAARNWPAFWAERRLLAGIGSIPRDVATRVETLARRLPDLSPRAPAPALLHGDLWSGNVLWRPDGLSGLIDPACYHGDAEVDLAMLGLFGQIGDGFRDGYGAESFGETARRPIYQLWPALVHLRLFGDGYRGMVNHLLDAVIV